MPAEDYQQQAADQDQELQQEETYSLLDKIWQALQTKRRIAAIHSYRAMQQQQDLSKLCLAGFDPLYNDKGQNPCQVARILADACLTERQGPQFYPLYPLAVDQDQDHYVPPNGAQQSPCVCSMATYNLVQACAACQHSDGSSSTLWTYFVGNCTEATHYGFPFDVPWQTAIPIWALQDNSGSATNIQLALHYATGGGKSSASSSSQSTSHSSTATSSSPAASSTAPSDTPAPALGQTEEKPEKHGPPAASIAASVLVVVFAAGLIGVLVAYIRKRRRTRRQGQRLGSTSDLVAPSVTVHDEMVQKPDSRASFLPTETFYSRDSRTSFATNSVSTRSRDYRNSLAAPSTFYATSHSSDFTLDRDYDDDEDDSISPFSDIHQPPGVRTATRDNLHSRPDSISSTFYSGPTRSSVAASRDTMTLDGMSLLSERSPPSSTGATYGREHDFDDEDLISLSSRRSSRR
ncbi:hypothetical protein BCR35DRAFT_297849 [Leucosporidium creatinivorum]|uniref:Uncharacterized protein n=1 Tax=Leucosporidium creatinivorum TaxID=106004 RepID=A0A1Y2G3B2_9BASI|nr:hypothetical protein BCR35DRAFT_297849 [Leucosporidium creatinivorum]